MEKKYDFPVTREKLERSDGVDTGYDTLYRPDTGSNLGVVSRKYQMVKHADAMEMVFGILDRMKLEHSEPRVKLSGQGKRMYSSIPFPDMRFNPTEGLEDFNGKEDFDPVMRVHNSYDGSLKFSFLYGVEKLICTNGATVFKAAQSISLRHVSENIDFDKIRPTIETSLDKTIVKTKDQVNKLVSEDGFNYLNLIMAESVLANTYKRAIIEAIGENHIDSVKDNRGNIVEFSEGVDPFTAYYLWNIITNVSTHKIKSANVQADVDAMITKHFF